MALDVNPIQAVPMTRTKHAADKLEPSPRTHTCTRTRRAFKGFTLTV